MAASNFSDLGSAMMTLYALLCMDDVQMMFPFFVRPLLVCFFAVYMFVLPVALMNLVTAIIVESSQRAAKENAEGQKLYEQAKLAQIMPEIRTIFHNIDATGEGEVHLDDLLHAPKEIRERLQDMAHIEDLETLFQMLDHEDQGALNIDEFCEGIWRAQGDKPMELMRIMRQCTDILVGVRTVLDLQAASHVSHFVAGGSHCDGMSVNYRKETFGTPGPSHLLGGSAVVPQISGGGSFIHPVRSDRPTVRAEK
eukprot:gnl/TRDRNA2_/TRDRNA2_72144_c0_seq1.p1 gnl/TRDRNA2_/TRDRNA2_72144_c0~~gnl/TRDRNA2_/TRDRNA2_72144_c0_seq1.p1  ORF type:complete len:253 (-),score=41.98 gnl/TRDRNA2_/TRDRNA2_72144_c0_seq1:312-1070(-)